MHNEHHPDEPYSADPAASPNDTHENAGAEQRPEIVSSVRIVYCTNCGAQLDGLRIGEPCPHCQTPVGGAARTGSTTDGKAVAALILGICSIVGCMFYGLPGIVCGVLALYFSGKVNEGIASGDIDSASMGMNKAGRICGIIGLSLSVLYLVLSLIWLAFIIFMIANE